MEQALNPTKFELAEIVESDHRFAAKMFKCGKCTCIPLNPVQAPPSAECGHLFCMSCADEPRLPLPQGSIVTNLYAELPVHCPYSSAHSKSANSGSLDGSVGDTETCADDQETTDEEKVDEEKGEDGEGEQARHLTRPVVEEAQCGWKGTMQEMRRHLLECPFQFIKCPSGTVFRRKDTENHRQTECPCTFETCSICDERVKVGTMEQHRAEKAGEHLPLLEEKFKTDIEALAKRLSELEVTVKERDHDIKASENRISELEDTVKERESDIKASENRISEFEGTVKVQQKRQCELNLKEWQKRISLEEKMKERETDIEASKSRISELEGILKERETDIEASKSRISELEGIVKERESDIKASENRISKLEGTLKDRESDIKASENRISKFEGTAKELLARQSQGSIFEWEIKNPVEMKAKHPKAGDSFFSPEFFLRGLGPWKVSIYPSGESRAPGEVAAFLHGSASTASAKVQWHLTVNGASIGPEEDVFDGTRATAWGRTKFPGVAWPATNDEPVRVKVELLKVTHIATTK